MYTIYVNLLQIGNVNFVLCRKCNKVKRLLDALFCLPCSCDLRKICTFIHQIESSLNASDKQQPQNNFLQLNFSAFCSQNGCIFEFEYHVSVIKTCLKSERPISTKHARFVQASPLFCENKIPVKIVFVFMAGIFYMCQRL